METDATRICELLLNLPEMTVVAFDESDPAVRESPRSIPTRISSRSSADNGLAGMLGTPLVRRCVDSSHHGCHHAPTSGNPRLLL